MTIVCKCVTDLSYEHNKLFTELSNSMVHSLSWEIGTSKLSKKVHVCIHDSLSLDWSWGILIEPASTSSISLSSTLLLLSLSLDLVYRRASYL